MPAIPTARPAPDPEPELERPPAHKREREVYGPDGYMTGVQRQLRALARRAATGDLDALTALEELRTGYIEEVMATIAIPGLRSEEGGRYANREIGVALGYSETCARQAVHNRFPGNGARRPGGQPANLR